MREPLGSAGSTNTIVIAARRRPTDGHGKRHDGQPSDGHQDQEHVI
jgi:hypothetical protein